MTDKRTYGLYLERENSHGTEYVGAKLIAREDGRDYPVGVSDLWLTDPPKHLAGLALDGLTIRGFISESNDLSFIGYDPEFRDIYSVDLPTARKMVKTLDKVTKRRRADNAYEPGDTLVSLAKALKLDFVVTRRGRARGSSWSDADWNWMTITEGRNRFRDMIEEARNDVKARKAA